LQRDCAPRFEQFDRHLRERRLIHATLFSSSKRRAWLRADSSPGEGGVSVIGIFALRLKRIPHYHFNMLNDLKDCYRLLELKPGATLDEVKRGYRELVKVWHPDRFTEDAVLQQKAQEKLKRINAAYEAIMAYLANGQEDLPPEEPEVQPKARSKPTASEIYRLGLDRYSAKDYKGALHFFMQAAEMGHADAGYAVGFIYYQHTTRNVFTLNKQVKNDHAAFSWWTRAAERGSANAEYMLGICYLYGQSTAYNEGEARKWFERAGSKGHPHARKRLKTMDSWTGLADKFRAVPLAKWIMEAPPAAPQPK
jgi:curved DNA-binding protein CbpA